MLGVSFPHDMPLLISGTRQLYIYWNIGIFLMVYICDPYPILVIYFSRSKMSPLIAMTPKTIILTPLLILFIFCVLLLLTPRWAQLSLKEYRECHYSSQPAWKQMIWCKYPSFPNILTPQILTFIYFSFQHWWRLGL